MSIQYILDMYRARDAGFRVVGPSPEFQPTYYLAKIISAKSIWRQRDGFKFVIEKLWVGWHTHYTSSWYANQEDCERAANSWLDEKEPHVVIKKI